jgi:hypothetical protein
VGVEWCRHVRVLGHAASDGCQGGWWSKTRQGQACIACKRLLTLAWPQLTCKQEWDMMHPDYLIPKPGILLRMLPTCRGPRARAPAPAPARGGRVHGASTHVEACTVAAAAAAAGMEGSRELRRRGGWSTDVLWRNLLVR